MDEYTNLAGCVMNIWGKKKKKQSSAAQIYVNFCLIFEHLKRNNGGNLFAKSLQVLFLNAKYKLVN